MPRSPEQDQFTWVVLNDFSPGIQQRIPNAGTSPYFQPGAATLNTYRCIALPNGGLGPLPKRYLSYTRAALTPAPDNGHFTISGFHASGPILAAGGGGIDAAEFHLAFEWVSGSHRYYKWERHRMWEASPTIDTLVSYAPTTEGAITGFAARPTSFHDYRAHPSDATQPGTPTVVAAWYAGGGAWEKLWAMFPNPAAANVNGLYNVSATLALDFAIGHQGRSVGFNQIAWDHGTPGTWSFNEQIFFTNSNLRDLQNTIAETFGQENATGYACVGSLSASELLLLKLKDGAYLVRGDINNPVVLRLPGVISPGNAKNYGASTPIGFIYGVLGGGIWCWNGGETSECISSQLDPNLWLGGSGDFLDYHGSFATFREWVVGPNNLLYDYKRKSWWRLDDPSQVQITTWSPAILGSAVYGAPSTYTDNTTPVVYGYDTGTLATNFRWEGQPLPQSMDQTSKVREIVLVAQGSGTVTITLRALNPTTNTIDTSSVTFTVNNTNYPVPIRKNFSGPNMMHIQVRIDSDGGSNPAPTVYEVRLQTHQATTHLPAS